jgi:hypothetical protein
VTVLIFACTPEPKATQKDMDSAYKACPELKKDTNWGKGMPLKYLQKLVAECQKPNKKK